MQPANDAGVVAVEDGAVAGDAAGPSGVSPSKPADSDIHLPNLLTEVMHTANNTADKVCDTIPQHG